MNGRGCLEVEGVEQSDGNGVSSKSRRLFRLIALSCLSIKGNGLMENCK
jgi:hypothetical protein